MGFDSNFRHLAVEVGGPKRLYAMVNIISTFFLVPFATLAILLSQVNSLIQVKFIMLHF